jgi:hypothetical protein
MKAEVRRQEAEGAKAYYTSFLPALNGRLLLQSLAGRKPTPPTLRYFRRVVLLII